MISPCRADSSTRFVSCCCSSKDGGGSAPAITAAAADAVVRAAVSVAERSGGRLDPPALCVLDEAASVFRISDLPDLYSHLGSRGGIPMTVLQSCRPGQKVWREAGMDALRPAATIKIIGSGTDDARPCRHRCPGTWPAPQPGDGCPRRPRRRPAPLDHRHPATVNATLGPERPLCRPAACADPRGPRPQHATCLSTAPFTRHVSRRTHRPSTGPEPCMNQPRTMSAQLHHLADAFEDLSRRLPLAYSPPGPDRQHLSRALTEPATLLPLLTTAQHSPPSAAEYRRRPGMRA